MLQGEIGRRSRVCNFQIGEVPLDNLPVLKGEVDVRRRIVSISFSFCEQPVQLCCGLIEVPKFGPVGELLGDVLIGLSLQLFILPLYLLYFVTDCQNSRLIVL